MNLYDSIRTYIDDLEYVSIEQQDEITELKNKVDELDDTVYNLTQQIEEYKSKLEVLES